MNLLSIFLYDRNSEVFHLGIAWRKVPRLSGFSMLESQPQDQSVCKHTLSYAHKMARSIDDLFMLVFIDDWLCEISDLGSFEMKRFADGTLVRNLASQPHHITFFVFQSRRVVLMDDTSVRDYLSLSSHPQREYTMLIRLSIPSLSRHRHALHHTHALT